ASSAPTARPAAPRTREERIARMRELFAQGVQAYEAGRLDEALRLMLEAQHNWRNPALAYNIARIYERMADAERAAYWFRAYLTHGQPTEAERADIERRIAALREIEARQREQLHAPPPSQDALTAEARAFFQRGIVLYQRRHYEAALEAFLAALRFAPLPELYYNLALVSERLGRRSDAIDYYREYLRVRPGASERAWVERRIEQLRAGR
ncbi:MAG: tetratricopeptide repeat protein, partial [Myxococcales bacterium]|nr:tetratricopeptide repeat protein [Myxococcales bacterium]